jgi:hypothetical protein
VIQSSCILLYCSDLQLHKAHKYTEKFNSRVVSCANFTLGTLSYSRILKFQETKSYKENKKLKDNKSILYKRELKPENFVNDKKTPQTSL